MLKEGESADTVDGLGLPRQRRRPQGRSYPDEVPNLGSSVSCGGCDSRRDVDSFDIQVIKGWRWINRVESSLDIS